MTETIVKRETIVEANYREIFERESHHDHEIIKDERGILRWRSNPAVCKLVDKLDLNVIVGLFYDLGLTKNSEVYRKLYRDMGYSLEGYWEAFYWTLNNPHAGRYGRGGVCGVLVVEIGRLTEPNKG